MKDAEYEAQPEDCIYVFATCITIVLSRDPIELIRVRDVRELIESPNKTLSPDLLEDYGKAPEVRQTEIVRMLVGVARATKEPDLVRQHAVEALRTFAPLTDDKVKITVASEIHEQLQGRPLQAVEMKIAAAIEAVPYLKQRRVTAFYTEIGDKLLKISPDWGSYQRHRDPLNEIEDYGGLAVIPDDQLPAYLALAGDLLSGRTGRLWPMGSQPHRLQQRRRRADHRAADQGRRRAGSAATRSQRERQEDRRSDEPSAD